jgi:Hemerythrin HHE cation binding domain
MNVLIHGAIRRDLARFLGATANLPDGAEQRAAQLAVAWAYFSGELDYHHRGEHEIAWPALASVGVSADVLAEMDAEHDRLAGALKAADTAFAGLRSTPTAANAQAAHTALERLRDVAEEHMRHEEAELEPVYAAQHDTPELKEMGRKFSRRNPRGVGNFLAWIGNGASPEEHAALRATIPPPVIAVFTAVFGGHYRRRVAPAWRA